jgi:hypothetical protein
MNLVKNLRQKLADTEPTSERHDLQVTDAGSGSAVTIATLQSDAMSCLALELSVRRPAPPGVDMRQWAERIAERVTSLLEPLKVLEVDTQRGQALLRSAVGVRNQDSSLTYFEVILEGTTSADVRRYQTATQADDTASTRRIQVAFALTHEGLLKLVSDLVAA